MLKKKKDIPAGGKFRAHVEAGLSNRLPGRCLVTRPATEGTARSLSPQVIPRGAPSK